MTIALERMQANLAVTQATSPTRASRSQQAAADHRELHAGRCSCSSTASRRCARLPVTSFLRVDQHPRADPPRSVVRQPTILYTAGYWYESNDIQGPWRHKLIAGFRLDQAKDLAEVRRGHPDVRQRGEAGLRRLDPDDLHEPGAGCARASERPAAARADRQHVAARGHQHHRRRLPRQRRPATTTSASPDAGSRRRRSTVRGPSSPRTRCRRTSRRSRRSIRRRTCCRRWPAPSRRAKR